MKLLTVLLLALLVLLGSTSTLADPALAASPRTTVISVGYVTPAFGAIVSEKSVIEAEIEYEIAEFDSASEYYIAPMFDSSEPPGSTFNKNNRVSDGLRVKQSSGITHLRYPINREWASPKLVKPLRVRFVLMKSTDAQRANTIAKSSVIVFAVAE